MGDAMQFSIAMNRLVENFLFMLSIVLFLSLAIIISVIVIRRLIKKAGKIDPAGNAKRLLRHRIIAWLIGIIIIIIAVSLPLLISMPVLIHIAILEIIPIVLITIIACLYSPMAGFFAGFFGFIIGFFLNHSNLGFGMWLLLGERFFYITIGLYGLVIGLIWRKLTAHKNKLAVKTLIAFCALQAICNIVLCYLIFFIPYLSHFFDFLQRSMVYFVIQTVIIAVVLYVYKNKYKPRSTEQ